ncbi:rRNA maturation RNase YbeY [Mycoplasma sp. 'Moose RK']|uniref:rRNA maturation RNase YbeY n=1 Tax=Mycoplasma sp. 'Moose RK' TaxID=2780095 RepID=UPI0018C30CFC|nr:rRNA maturation RNase YbeY [Mycoplasma sp. 'Moose RK']MBG0730939.1 rRNA maturation RNase YbeY [Mycoplasma sp. 'Moose RK']
MQLKIHFLNQSKISFNYLKLFRKIFALIAKYENFSGEINLDLTLISMQKAQKLAIKYKNKNYVPDVLSFPNDLVIQENGIKLKFLGEIFMTPAKIYEQAKKYGHSTKREFSYLFAHSLYHLLGFDHQDEKTNQFMHEKVEKILEELEIMR